MVLNFADSFTLGGPYGTAGTFESNNSLQSAGGQVGTSFVHNSFAVMKDLVCQQAIQKFNANQLP